MRSIQISPDCRYILLCEGWADKAFFEKLIDVRRLPKVDIPWPHDDSKFHGKDSFGEMLLALGNYFTFRPELLRQISGIVIATDSGDDPKATFRSVVKQIRAANFGFPSEPTSFSESQPPFPSTAVLLIPGNGRPGGLETLCVDNLLRRLPSLGVCLAQYLACGSRIEHSGIDKWGAEKQDKARLQCLIAVTNKRDPTKSVRYAFSDNHSEPIIDLKSSCFDPLAGDIERLCKPIASS